MKFKFKYWCDQQGCYFKTNSKDEKNAHRLETGHSIKVYREGKEA